MIELFAAAGGNHLFAYQINLGVPFLIWYKTKPAAVLIVSKDNWNLHLLSGRYNPGSFNNLVLISLKAF